MKRKKEETPGHGKLLDAWTPPEDAGVAIGCIATTFTFSATFFEEECLSRFLQLETDATEDGPAYLVEREEKLCQLTCAAAVVDQHHCKGTRSLRWDLLPVRTKGGVLHAKITLLHWQHATRLIVASANLTADGYRRNQEVFGVLDYSVKGEAPVSVLRDSLAFLRQTVSTDPGGAEGSPAVERVMVLLDRVWQASKDWGESEEQHSRRPLRVNFISSTPQSPNVIAKLESVWPGGAPPSKAWVISPFYDPPEGDNRPAIALWNIMRQRGCSRVSYCMEMDEVPGQKTLFARAPDNLLSAKPSRRSATHSFFRLILDQLRPLHAKAIWLEDENSRWATYIIGSSNFTSPGLGLSKIPNIEANLVYSVDSRRDIKNYEHLRQALPKCNEIADLNTLQFTPPAAGSSDSVTDEEILPDAFASASYDHKNGKGTVMLIIKGTPPDGWFLLKDSGSKEPCFSEKEWRSAGSPVKFALPWTDTRPPSGFLVRWTGCRSSAWLPVNIVSSTALPPPDELWDLPLDALIDILTSARPLHQALRVYLANRAHADVGGSGKQQFDQVDAHKRVDTTGYLLQRTRRVSRALAGLRERLERPVVSKESLEWRLLGPVGVLALRNALDKEAKSNEERMFLLSELALELNACFPKTAVGCLPAAEVRSEILRLAGEIIASVLQNAGSIEAGMKRYIDIVARTICI